MVTETPALVATPEERVLDAAVACVARWGLAKTTLDDIAREAGLSRASVYRRFPGGKAALLQEAGQRELRRALAELIEALETAETLEQVVTDGIVAAAAALHDHPAVRQLIEHEADVVRPLLAFDRITPGLLLAAELCGPTLHRFVPPRAAAELVEQCSRLVLSLTFVPGSVDLGDHDAVGRYVRAYVLPGVERLAAGPTTDPSTDPTTADHPGGTP